MIGRRFGGRRPGERGRPRCGERGDVSIEAAIVAPVLFFLMFAGLLVAGRSVQAKSQAESAAQEAARAASLEQTSGAAIAAGQRAMAANVDDATGMTCAASIETGDLGPGSLVEVEVSCDADLVVGRSATFTGRAVEVVDRFREGEEG